MKKRYFIVGSLAFLQFWANAQKKDTTANKLDKTTIELVYKHYSQNGSNSAVTGGIGTEKLTVQGADMKLKWSRSKSYFTLNYGFDIISSASTDKIDFVASSASSHDQRGYINGTYERNFKKSNSSLVLGTGLSLESDYNSVSAKIGYNKASKDQMSKYTALFQYFDDDLRWGLLNSDERNPQELIYPSELRHIDWHDEFKRYSYNLKLGYEQVLNKRNVLGLFPEVAYQHGLLSTPFHRVYFTNDSIAVEDFPDRRLKAGLSARLNTFTTGGLILKHTVNLYTDDFGINSISIANETVVKLSPVWALMPNFRWYSQSASSFSAPFEAHDPLLPYHTSDYDLSKFTSYNIGMGVKHSPGGRMGSFGVFNDLIFRYNYFNRSNGLEAHSFSLAVLVDFYRSTKAQRLQWQQSKDK